MRPRVSSPPLSFGATAEYNRSGQPRAPLLLLGSAVDASNPPCAGQGEYPGIETTVKTATAHPAFGWSLLVEGSLPPSLQDSHRASPTGSGAGLRSQSSSASPSQVAETSRERVTLPSRFRVTDVFAPLRRQRASTTAGAASLATARVRPFAKLAPRAFPDKSGAGSEGCLAAFPTRCLGVWSLTRRAVGATRYLP